VEEDRPHPDPEHGDGQIAGGGGQQPTSHEELDHDPGAAEAAAAEQVGIDLEEDGGHQDGRDDPGHGVQDDHALSVADRGFGAGRGPALSGG